MNAAQGAKIALALEELVTKTVRDFNFGMDVLRLPPSVRQPMWDALARRSATKSTECVEAMRKDAKAS